MTQLKYFQPTTGSPVTPSIVVSGTSTVTVPGTVAVATGMAVIYSSGNINTTVTSIVNPNSFVVNSITGITTTTPLTIGTWITAVIGAQGPQGNDGSPGGAQGPQGNQGGMVVGGTATLSGGADATVVNSGTQGASILYFGIPQGYQGVSGTPGAQGSTGPQGFQGPPGYGVSSAATPAGLANLTYTTASSILGSNSNRKQVWVYNTTYGEIVYLSLGGTAASGSGIRINPGGGYWTSTLYTGAISAICTNTGAGGSASVSFTEI